MRHTPARFKLIFALYPMSEYSDGQIKLAMLMAAYLRRGELWLIEAPHA